MYDLQANLEPGNPDGHTVLRYLIESKQMPLEVAIDQVYRAINKFAQEYRSDQKKLLTGMVVTGVLSLPIFFPFGISSVLIAGAIGASAFTWQELGAMKDRLKPEYAALKNSVLLEQFIKWLAQELKERRKNDLAVSSTSFQSDALSTANIIAAYEHTVFAITSGEHLENNASDPVLALFVLKLRQHSNHLPEWVMGAFKQLEQAEAQRSNDMHQASAYMWGNQEPQQRIPIQRPAQNVLPIADASAPVGEGEQRLGKPIEIDFFNFDELRVQTDKFAHLRVIGATGIGKTIFVDWLLDVIGGDRFIITPKKKAWHWSGLKVYGLWFDYDVIRAKLEWLHSEMYRRYPLMEKGQAFETCNFVVDEWRLINTNIKPIKERDPETKQMIEKSPSAKAMMKDIISAAREASLRLIALAQGENVATWGFEGESDLEECFTDIRLGDFAIDYAKSLRSNYQEKTDEHRYWTAIIRELEQNGRYSKNGKPIPVCMVGKRIALIPDLSDWSRDIKGIQLVEDTQASLTKTEFSTVEKDDFHGNNGKPKNFPGTEAEKPGNLAGMGAERISEKIVEKVETEISRVSGDFTPLFEGVEKAEKLMILRLLLAKKTGKDRIIVLGWSLKPGGRNHDKYKLSMELLEAMILELSRQGLNPENNWGI
jgi:hypothetical protein